MFHNHYAVCLSLALSLSSIHAGIFDTQEKTAMDRSFGMLIDCDFASCIRYADSLMTGDTAVPLYPFIKLCALGLRDLDLDRIVDTASFIAVYDKTLSRLRAYEANRGASAYTMMIRGCTDYIHSAFYLLHKKYFSAVRTGMHAVSAFKEIQKMEGNNADAGFFLGCYTYAKGELKKKLWMVLFWYPGSKREAIAALEYARTSGELTNEIAAFALADMYRMEKKYAASKTLIDSLSKRYPRSRFVHWSLARYLEDMRSYHEAAVAYETLARRYEEVAYGDYGVLTTRLKQIEMLKKGGFQGQANAVRALVLETMKKNTGDKRYNGLLSEIEEGMVE